MEFCIRLAEFQLSELLTILVYIGRWLQGAVPHDRICSAAPHCSLCDACPQNKLVQTIV